MAIRNGIGIDRKSGGSYWTELNKAFKNNPPDINILSANRALTPLDIPVYNVDVDKGCTHPDVLDFYTITGGKWNGYRYWMVYTPLPATNPDTYENPSIVVSNDLITWIVPAGLTNPVYLKGALGYQADPDLIYDSGKLYIVWRGRNPSNDVVICYGYSTDGINWSNKEYMAFDAGINMGLEVVSPAIIKDTVGYSIYAVDTSVDETGTVEDYSIKKYTSASIDGTWILNGVVSLDYSLTKLPTRVAAGAGTWYPWHINAVKIGGVYYLIIFIRCVSADNIQLFLANSADGDSFVFSKYAIMSPDYPLYGTWDTAFYRSSIIPFRENGENKFHLYYGGEYNGYGVYPYRIGYAKIEKKDTYIAIGTSSNTIGSSRASELVLANGHNENYIFADSFNRVLETVNGVGVASDGILYKNESANYWMVSGDYAYLNSNTTSYLRLELTASFVLKTTIESPDLSTYIYVKYIDANNYIIVEADKIAYKHGAGAQANLIRCYHRYKIAEINEYEISFDNGLLEVIVNGNTIMQHQFVIGDFDDQTQMDAFLNERTVRISIAHTTTKIYDITAQILNDCKDPIIAPLNTSFTSSQLVTLTNTLSNGASIYYTTDGSDPDETDNLYTVPFSITESQEIRAVCIKTGLRSSNIVSSILLDTEEYTPSYIALFEAFTTKPSFAEVVSQNTIISSIGSTAWGKIEKWLMLAQTVNTNNEALLDWVDPTKIATLSAIAPAFAPLEGFTMVAANAKYIDTKFIPANGVKYNQNAASVIIYTRTDGQDAGYDFATYDGTRFSQVTFRNTSDLTSAAFNGANATYAAGAGAGLWVLNRINVTQVEVYRNGSLVTILASNSAALSTLSYYLGARHNTGAPTGGTSRQYSLIAFGGVLTADDVTAITNSFEAYMDSNSKGVIV